MRYRLLGPTGLRVSEVCLGTMTFGDEAGEGWGASRQEAQRIFDVFTEAGGNFFDTAVNYCNGTSERYLGELVAGERDRYVVATKYSALLRPGDPNSGGNHRKAMIQALDRSLERLRTDYIDLYWVHAWDPLTPVDELMRALDDQVRAGKVLYVGMSDAPAWMISRANTFAESRGLTPFAAIQMAYSLIERSVERELAPMAAALDLALLAWAPLGRGLLTGKYTQGAGSSGRLGRLSGGDRQDNDRDLAIVAAVVDIATDLGVPPAAVAIAWLLGRPARAALPIIGARTAEQLEQSLSGAELQLPDEPRRRLDEVSSVPLGFPHDFLAGIYARGSAAIRIDSDRWHHAGVPQ